MNSSSNTEAEEMSSEEMEPNNFVPVSTVLFNTQGKMSTLDLKDTSGNFSRNLTQD